MAEDDKNEITGTGMGSKGQSDPVRDFAETTSRVVQKAASILEEEIAKGIIAAREVEDRFRNVSEAYAGRPDEMVRALGEEAQEAVGMAMNAIATKTISACIKLCEPICAISEYTIGVVFFGVSVGTITFRGQTKLYNCKDQAPPPDKPVVIN
jgi:hypothetical protein